MGSVNKVIIVGNLGHDPELKYVGANSAPLVNMSIATTEVWNDKNGRGRQEKTEWHRVVAWNDTAENCAKYLSKGRSVYIEGRLETQSYDKDGQKHYATKIVADKVVFLGGGQGGRREEDVGGGEERNPSGQRTQRGGQPAQERTRGGGRQEELDHMPRPMSDDDIPF